MALENIYDSLTDDQKAEAKACQTPEELVDLAKNEGVGRGARLFLVNPEKGYFILL